MMTAELDDRIARFEKMAQADPSNELGHFSLGKALIEADRFSEAAESLTKVIELNPKLSKAYQLLGEAHDKAGRRDQAIERLTKGVTVADDQGDRMPRDAMASLLKAWGAPVPEFKSDGGGSGATVGAGEVTAGFQCARCRQPHGKLAKPPFKGAIGEKIFNNVCEACWREWIPMGTKVINELGLVLRDPDSQSTYDQHMVEFLQLEDR